MAKIGRKWDPEFMALLPQCCSLDPKTGKLTFNSQMYASVALNIGWKGGVIPIPYSHVVWFLTYGRWPKDGYQLDHKNDDPLDNKPNNLNEVDHVGNQLKRRGRIVSRAYGTGKYGYGFYIYADPRDERFYVTRHLSRGHGNGELKTIKKGLGGFETFAEAELQVKMWIEEVKEHGLEWMPKSLATGQSPKTRKLLKMLPQIIAWRKEGATLAEIKKLTGFSEGTLSNHLKDIDVDRRTSRETGLKLTPEDVVCIKQEYADGITLAALGRKYNVSAEMIGDIVHRRAWKHVE